MARKTADTALALATLIAAGTSAYGDTVRFDNDGSYQFFGPLDITLPAADQTNVPNSAPHALALQSEVDKYFSIHRLVDLFEPAAGSVEFWCAPALYGNLYANPLDAGSLIGSNLSDGVWRNSANVVRDQLGYYYYGDDGGYYGDRYVFSPFEAGVPQYLALRVDLGYGDGFRYGWMGAVFDPDAPDSFHFLEAFAWGYETEAGVAVGAGVPAPGGIALLAFGAAGALSRKRAV